MAPRRKHPPSAASSAHPLTATGATLLPLALRRTRNEVPSEPLHWFARSVNGCPVDVFGSTGALTPELAGAHTGAVCVSGQVDRSDGLDRCWRIYIDVALPRHDQDVSVLHEFRHVHVWGNHNWTSYTEEKIWNMLDRHELAFLASLGLKLPPRPRGWAALERFAQAKG